MPLKFIKSQKNTNLLLHDGIVYSRKKVNKNNISWICAVDKYCSKIIHTDCEDKKGNIIGDIPVHDHAINAAVIQTKIIKATIRRKAEKTDTKPAKILSAALRGIKSPVSALMPMTASISRSIQRTRMRHNPQFNNPTTRGELELPDEYKKTYNNELFLLHDSGDDRNRFLVFTTNKNLNFLIKCEQWLSDGTFKSVPNIFCQLYTIHGYMSGKSVPLVYLLAPNKSKKMYMNFLKILRQHLPNYFPQRIMVDFEKPFIDAIKEIYPGIKISGCNFHFTQCVWRHVQSCGLQARYNKDVTFALNLRLLMALAYVPVNDVMSAYELIVASEFYDIHHEILDDLLDYFVMTWIGKPRHNRKKRDKPLFEPKLWNYYRAVINDGVTSNNFMEGWHNSFNQRVSVAHATVGKFLNAVKDEQTKTEMLISQIDTGLNVGTSKPKAYRNYHIRLKNIVLNYDPNNKLEYLQNIAKLLFINN